MATFTTGDFGKKLTRIPEGGNAFCESFKYTTPAAGIASGSLINFGIIPAGVEINAVKATNDAMGASVTLQLGYTPVDANNGPSADLVGFFGATSVASAGTVLSAKHPLQFEFPVILQAATAGAATTAAALAISVTTSGKVVGTK